MTTTIDKLKAKAAQLDAQADALRLAAYFLDEEARLGKRGTLGRTLSGAIALRHAQRNGDEPEPEPAPRVAKPAKKPRRKGVWKATVARRAQKREQLLAIVRAYGKPMPLAELAEAARKQRLGSLTGISGSVRAGYLKKTGRKGKTFYSVPASASPRPA